MAMNIQDLIDRVTQLLQTRRSESVIPARPDDLESMLPAVCHRFAMGALDRPKRKQQLTHDYSFTFEADGTYDLDDSPDLLVESITHSTRIVASSYSEPLDWYRNRAELERGEPYIGLARYTVEGGILRTKVGTGATAIDNTTTGTIYSAIRIPTIGADASDTTLPEKLEDDFVDLMVAVQEVRGQPNTAPTGEGKD